MKLKIFAQKLKYTQNISNVNKRLGFLIIVLLFNILLVFSTIKPIYAETAYLYRTTKYEININKANPANTSITIYRSVKLTAYSLILPSSNYEYFNVCPADGKAKTKNQIKNTIHVLDNRNRSISYKIQSSGTCWLVTVPYPHSVSSSAPLYLHLNYIDPSVAIMRGGVIEASYPRLKSKPITTTTKVYGRNRIHISHNIDISFVVSKNDMSHLHIYIAGNTILPLKPTITYSNDTAILTYRLQDIWKTGVYFLLGDNRFVKFSIHIKQDKHRDLLNKVDSIVGFKQVILPRSDKQTGQLVYYSKINPKPLNVELSETGNLIATFPGGQDINIQGYARIYAKDVNIKSLINAKMQDYHISQYLTDYVSPSYPYWPSDNYQILQLANKLKKSTVLNTIVSDIDYILDHIKYNDDINFSNLSRKGAINALNSGSGVCMEFSDTLITLLRAQGIASRAVLGNVLTRFVDNNYTNIGHQWVEVYFPTKGWIIVDPTLSDKNSIVVNQNLNYFTYVHAKSVEDLSQLKCFSWSKSCNDVEMNVSFVNKLPNQENLLQEVDLLNNKRRNILGKGSINTFSTIIKLRSLIENINFTVFSNRLPELSITSLYIILFIIIYFIVYLITYIVRYIFKKAVRYLYLHSSKNVDSNTRRILETIQVSNPVTNIDNN